MNGGIDQEVQSRMDAYRGNPQQLMQNYQQNQQLIDLLALQKLKSEKEAAARDMQMQMQTNPQTIAEQREMEVLELTKREMQPQQAPPQPGQPAPQQQGLGGMPGAAQAFAEGGIVPKRYNGLGEEGSRVAGARSLMDIHAEGGDWIREGIERTLAAGGTREDALAAVRGDPRAVAILDEMGVGVESAPEAVAPTAEPSQRPEIPQYTDRPFAENVGESAGILAGGIKGLTRGYGNLLNSAGSALGKELSLDAFSKAYDPEGSEAENRAMLVKFLNDSGAGPDQVNRPDSMVAAPEATPVPESELEQLVAGGPGVPGGSDLRELRDAQFRKNFEIDPEVQARDAEARAQGMFGMSDEYKARMKSLMAEQDAAYRTANDPETLRKEQLRKFLQGMGGRSSFGSVMAGGSAGASGARDKQEQARKGGLAALIAGEKDFSKEKRETGAAIYTAGNSAQTRAQGTVDNNLTQVTNAIISEDRVMAARLKAMAEAGDPEAVKLNKVFEEITTSIDKRLKEDYRFDQAQRLLNSDKPKDVAQGRDLVSTLKEEYFDTDQNYMSAKRNMQQLGVAFDDGLPAGWTVTPK